MIAFCHVPPEIDESPGLPKEALLIDKSSGATNPEPPTRSYIAGSLLFGCVVVVAMTIFELIQSALIEDSGNLPTHITDVLFTLMAATIGASIALRKQETLIKRLSAEVDVRKRAENVLKVFSRAVEQAPDQIMVTDRNGTITYANPEFEKQTGYTHEEITGKTLKQLGPDNPGGVSFEAIWDTILAGNVHRAVLIKKKKNGELMHVETTIAPVRDCSGDITHVISTGKNITERLALEAQLNHAREMRVLGQVAAAVAHEVRNPLTGILVITDLVCRDLKDNPEYQVHLKHIKTQVNRLSSLMQGLLDLGKPIAPTSMRPVSLTKACEDAIELWQQYSPEQKHRVRLVTPNHGSSTDIMADSSKIQQVLINLLDNAAQHSPKGTDIRIVVTRPTGNNLRVSVTDQGSGISEENLNRVQEPFFTTRPGGTGLGLAIVKQTIELHGGNITLKNNTPRPGCTVQIDLPAAIEDTHEISSSSVPGVLFYDQVGASVSVGAYQ